MKIPALSSCPSSACTLARVYSWFSPQLPQDPRRIVTRCARRREGRRGQLISKKSSPAGAAIYTVLRDILSRATGQAGIPLVTAGVLSSVSYPRSGLPPCRRFPQPFRSQRQSCSSEAHRSGRSKTRASLSRLPPTASHSLQIRC